MATVLCVLYPDPVDGYPPRYVRDAIPVITHYADGQTAPTPAGPPGFHPGGFVGSVSGALGLRAYMEAHGHTLIVTSDKDGPDSEFERRLPEADVVISQPFWPAYLTAERIARAPKLKLALTAGIGSDHVDLDAAARAHITVAEVTGSNSISVAEHVVMTTLALVRNYLPSHAIAQQGGWNIADCVSRSYDVEGMHFGTVGAGRISRRAAPAAAVRAAAALHATPPARCIDRAGTRAHVSRRCRVARERRRHRQPADSAVPIDRAPVRRGDDRAHEARRVPDQHRARQAGRPRRGRECRHVRASRGLRRRRVVSAAGAGRSPVAHDAVQRDDPAYLGHVAVAQARYAAGTLEILQCWFDGKPIRNEYLIVDGGTLAGTGAQSYRLT